MEDHVRPLRILVVRYGPYDGHLRRNVLTLRNAGFAVDVICRRGPELAQDDSTEGITVLQMPVEHKRGTVWRYVVEYVSFLVLAAVTIAIRTISASRRYRYVEIDAPPDWLVLAAVLPRVLGAKVVLYMFEDVFALLATDYDMAGNHPLVGVLLLVERICARFVDNVIMTNGTVRARLMRQGIASDRLVLVPNSPDEDVFLSQIRACHIGVPRSQRQLARSGIDGVESLEADCRFHLVTHGSLLERYGIQTLLEAMATARGHIPDSHLEIIGEGEFRSQLEVLTCKLELSSIVAFREHLPFDRIALRLVEADLAVVPMWCDALPLKLLEYLALGLPVIASDVPALRMHFDDSVIWYVQPKNVEALADAIVTLYSRPDRRAALAARGHQVYRERFTWQRIKQDYLAVYGIQADVACQSYPTSKRAGSYR